MNFNFFWKFIKFGFSIYDVHLWAGRGPVDDLRVSATVRSGILHAQTAMRRRPQNAQIRLLKFKKK